MNVARRYFLPVVIVLAMLAVFCCPDTARAGFGNDGFSKNFWRWTGYFWSDGYHANPGYQQYQEPSHAEGGYYNFYGGTYQGPANASATPAVPNNERSILVPPAPAPASAAPRPVYRDPVMPRGSNGF